jgi:Transposase DDE domain
METKPLSVKDDYDYLVSFLPVGWREKAKELGALRRCRKVPNADILLRVLLLHLGEGCSLRETSALARQGGLADLSDVAIMDRLRLSSEWFRWMNEQIMYTWVDRQPTAVLGTRWNIRIVDGTRVLEPGPTGASWLIHYSIGIPSLLCDEIIASPNGELGETFKRFTVHPGDLFIGDRAYGVRPGIFHVAEAEGDVLVRFAMDNLPLQTRLGRPFHLLKKLRSLGPRAIGDWMVQLEHNGQTLEGRVCAIRKSRQAAEQARKDVIRQAQKSGCKPKAETLEAAGFIFVFTTLDREALTARDALEMYRGRWQIELVFKRLKSILGLGHLRKIDEQAAKAWLHGKLLVAFIIEMLICKGEAFFPWGYPLCETQ